MNECGGWACPSWEGGNILSEGGVVDLVKKDAEESGSLITRVRTQLRVYLNDEGGGYCGEKTGLMFALARVQENLTQD